MFIHGCLVSNKEGCSFYKKWCFIGVLLQIMCNKSCSFYNTVPTIIALFRSFVGKRFYFGGGSSSTYGVFHTNNIVLYEGFSKLCPVVSSSNSSNYILIIGPPIVSHTLSPTAHMCTFGP